MVEFKSRFFSHLNQVYPAWELSRLWDIIYQEYRIENGILVLKKGDLQIYSVLVDDVLNRLHNREPIDYIIGYKPFLDLDILVDDAVLIPRPETEELVYYVIEELKMKTSDTLKILEVGCGSGCIALALQHYLPHAEIDSIDISEDALTVARRNAELHNLNVNFKLLDFIDEDNWDVLSDAYDVIISNPPYIDVSEKNMMDDHVVKYEPDAALYPLGDDPLIFYRKIATFAKSHLAHDGNIYVECNALRADEIKSIFDVHFTTKLIGDMQGLPRVLSANSAL